MISKSVDAGGIAEVVVDHPPVNALPVAGWFELADAVRTAGEDPAVRVVVLRAEGRGFNAGVDIKEFQADGPAALIGANRGCFAAFAAVYDCAVPVISAVQGFCLGGGIGLVGNSDIIIASEDATFGLPEVDRGALGAATHLSRLVPLHKARAMMYTSATATAAELHAFGSVLEVVPREQLRESALRIAGEIAAKNPAVIRMAKEAFNGIDLWDVKRSYRYEQGFTFELNLSGVSDEIRESFGSDGRDMDLRWSAEEDAFRQEARSWLEANVPVGLPSGDTREGFAAHLEWERALFAARWSAVSWPERFGGRDASLWQWLIFEEEYYRAGAPQRVTQNGIFLLAPTIFEFGTPEQQERLLPRMAAAENLWGQGWSEPGAGSDLAAVSSRAVRDEARGGWLLSGQKTWTTRGAFCTHLFGLFRTDPDAQKHHGLTYFLVPLDADGVTVRGFERLDGDEGFAEVFFDAVFVPDADVLGGVNEGWRVAMATTGSERGLTLRSPGRFMTSADRLIELARAHPETRARDRVVQSWIDAQAYQMFTLRQVTSIADGRPVGAESSLNKLFWSELDVRLQETAMDLLGEESELDGPWSRGFLFSLAGPIYAGTNEVQRNVVAERLLGLPRK